MSNIRTRDGRTIVLPSEEEDVWICAGIAADPDTVELDEAFFARAHRLCKPIEDTDISNPFGNLGKAG